MRTKRKKRLSGADLKATGVSHNTVVGRARRPGEQIAVIHEDLTRTHRQDAAALDRGNTT